VNKIEPEKYKCAGLQKVQTSNKVLFTKMYFKRSGGEQIWISTSRRNNGLHSKVHLHNQSFSVARAVCKKRA